MNRVSYQIEYLQDGEWAECGLLKTGERGNVFHSMPNGSKTLMRGLMRNTAIEVASTMDRLDGKLKHRIRREPQP